ncbi:MAG: ADOP family duplicated permease [Gemmatimonadales bacterium]
MIRWPGVRRIFRLDRGDVERGVDDEIAFHFEMRLAELEARGLSPGDARLEAERQFGDVPTLRRRLTAIDQTHAARLHAGERFANVAQDLRFAIRGLRMRPLFTLAIAATLALGIGANVTMFGVVDRLLFRPPAYLPHPSQVNRVYLTRTVNGHARSTAAMPYNRYRDLTNWSSTLAGTAAVFDNQLALGTGESVQQLPVEAVSASFWPLFSARPVVGRFFTAEEDRPPGGTAVAVLGYDYWRMAYGGAADAIGKSVQIGRQSYVVVGVAPRGFMGLATEPPAAFVPLAAASVELGGGDQYARGYGWNWLSMVARRKPGVSVAQASADLSNAFRRSYAVQRTGDAGTAPAAAAQPRAIAAPLLIERGPNQGSDSKVATWLIAVAAIVLIIACANVGNLLLARALTRRRETAVRLALGISRSRLLGQLLVESLLLAAVGGILGLTIAHWGGAIVRAAFLPDSAVVSTWTDSRLLAFTAAAVLLAGAIAGIVPAMQTTRVDVTTALKAGARQGGQLRSRVRNALLIVQASLSLILLVGAGLFVQSLHRANTTRLGYDADRLLWVSVGTRGTALSDTQRQELMWRMLDIVRRRSDVESASRIVSVPFQLTLGNDLYITGIDSVSRLGLFQEQDISGDYFRTMGTAILRGEPISDAHTTDSSRVMVVSQSMAQVLWPRQNAIGQCVRIGADSMPCTRVIGVAEDIKTGSLGPDPGLMYYLPIGVAGSDGGVFVRTRGPATMRAEPIRRALQQAMPGASFVRIKPFASIIDRQTRSWKLGATMFTVFAGLALLIAAMGLYSVVSYGVTQRKHEMGVRVALGAQTRDIVRLVTGEVLAIVLIAVAIGVAVVFAVARWVGPLLFGTSPRDPATLATGGGILVVVALAAGWIPALRAARADPNAALRSE